MEILEKLRVWLLSYPGWGSHTLMVEDTDGRPGSGSLHIEGFQELDSQSDVNGSTLTENRLTVLLQRITTGPEGATWLLDFHDWVQRQSVQGDHPGLGVLPDQEKIRAIEGKRKTRYDDGSWVYQVKLQIDYYTYLEGVNENDGHF